MTNFSAKRLRRVRCLPVVMVLVPAWASLVPSFAEQKSAEQAAAKTPATMTKMVVRLASPDVKPGSFSALPKTIFRAGERYARIEDPPDARQKIQKLTVIVGSDAYSVNLIDKTGVHAIDQGGPGALHLPIIMPLDPKHRLGKIDGIEFGSELAFFESAGAQKQNGPEINAKPTDEYVLKGPGGTVTLVLRREGELPVWLSWETPEGKYRYEYITYEDVPFDRSLFDKPSGIKWKEIPPDPDAKS